MPVGEERCCEEPSPSLEIPPSSPAPSAALMLPSPSDGDEPAHAVVNTRATVPPSAPPPASATPVAAFASSAGGGGSELTPPVPPDGEADCFFLFFFGLVVFTSTADDAAPEVEAVAVAVDEEPDVPTEVSGKSICR